MKINKNQNQSRWPLPRPFSSSRPRAASYHAGGGMRIAYLERTRLSARAKEQPAAAPDAARRAQADKTESQDAPHRLPAALLALNADIEHERAGGCVEIDLAPVPPAHDVLVLARLTRRLLCEDRDLQVVCASIYVRVEKQQSMGDGGRRGGRTIVSSVLMWCSVLCVFVAREETRVSTPFGLR